jgi:general stress protein YciG
MANTSKRGFASMDIEKQRLIASKGGRAAHAKGTAHEWSAEEARAAGRKGGESRGTRGRSSEAFASDAYGTGLNPIANAGQTGIGDGLIGGPSMIGSIGTNARSSNDITSSFLAEAGSSLRNSNATHATAPSSGNA